MRCISYRSGYKYQLHEAYAQKIPIIPQKNIVTEYIELNEEGLLSIKKGYAWNGPSGPAIDTLNFMRGSLVHDALYQLMRNEELNRDQHRKNADKLLMEMCREDGMSRTRAWCAYFGLRLVGSRAAHHKSKREIQKAPKPCK